MKKYLLWIENIFASFYYRIIRNTSINERKSSIYRIFIGLFFLVFPFNYLWLGDVPQGFFRPHVISIPNLFNELPPGYFFEILHFSIYILLLLVIIGIKARWSFFLLFTLTILGNSFSYSLGKIDHSIFYSLIFLLFALSNSGCKYALVPDKKRNYTQLAFAVFSIFLVFAFFTAGYEKALNWIDFDLQTSGVGSWFYGGYFNLDRNELLAPYFIYLPSLILECMDYVAVIFEISGLFFIWKSRKTWYLYLVIAVIFHLSNTLILNINFGKSLVVYGIWLLSPLLLKKPWLGGILFLAFFFEGLYLSTVLWLSLLFISIYSWKKGLYNFNETENSKPEPVLKFQENRT